MKKENSHLHKLFKMQELSILIVLIGLLVFFSLTSKVFLRSNNILNIARQSSLLGIMAMGMTMVIAVGGVDLGGRRVITNRSTSAAALMTKAHIPILISCLLAVGIGILFGLLNGVLIGYVKILPFIATMGTMNIARGLGVYSR